MGKYFQEGSNNADMKTIRIDIPVTLILDIMGFSLFALSKDSLLKLLVMIISYVLA